MAKVLVADGDREAADVLAEALRGHGHAARTCYSGQQCLRIAPEFQPDVVLLGRAGIDAESVRSLRRELPVIAIGARGGAKEPIDMLALMQSIRRALG